MVATQEKVQGKWTFHRCFQQQERGALAMDMGQMPPDSTKALLDPPCSPQHPEHPASRVLGPRGAVPVVQQQPRQQSSRNKSVSCALNRPACVEGGSPGRSPGPLSPPAPRLQGRAVQGSSGVPTLGTISLPMQRLNSP